jgi:hypothetical protein
MWPAFAAPAAMPKGPTGTPDKSQPAHA